LSQVVVQVLLSNFIFPGCYVSADFKQVILILLGMEAIA